MSADAGTAEERRALAWGGEAIGWARRGLLAGVVAAAVAAPLGMAVPRSGLVLSVAQFWLDWHLVATGLLALSFPVFMAWWAGRSYEFRSRWGAESAASVAWGVVGGVVLWTGMLPPLLAWSSSGLWSYSHIAGVLPWSDAAGYYFGALEFIHTQGLDSWNLRRPLNALWFAVRLVVAGRSFWGAMLLQAVFLGFSLWWAASLLRRWVSAASGVVFASLVLVFATPYLTTTLTEVLGLTLGVLAMAAMLSGALRGSRGDFLAGIFVLTLALSARAGAMLVLPLLSIWAGRVFARRRFSLRMFGASLLVVVVTLGGTAMATAALGVGARPMGNFTHTAYGLAKGGAGWTEAYQDFPLSQFDSETEQVDAILEATLAEVRRNPLGLVTGLVAGVGDFLREGAHIGWIGAAGPYGLWIGRGVVVVVLLGLVRRLRERRVRALFLPPAWAADDGGGSNARDALESLVVYVWIGILLSAPFVFGDGGHRVFAATIAFVALAPALLLGGWQDPRSRFAVIGGPVLGRRAGPPAGVIVGSTTTVFLLGPLLLGFLLPQQNSRTTPECAKEDLRGVVVRAGPGMPHVSVMEGAASRSWRPGEVAENDFHEKGYAPQHEIAATLEGVQGGETLFYAYDVASESERRQLLVIASSHVYPTARDEYLAMCVRSAEGPRAEDFNVVEAEWVRIQEAAKR